MATEIQSLIQSVRYKIHDIDVVPVWSDAEITGYIKEAIKKMAQYRYVNTDNVEYAISGVTITPTLKTGDESLTTDISKILILAHTGVSFETEEISVKEFGTLRGDEEFIAYIIDLARGQKFGLIGYYGTDDNCDINISFDS